MRNYPNTRKLSLKQLTVKLTVLLALVTVQRPQTLQALSLDGMRVSEDQYTFRVLSLLKQSSRHGGTNRHLAPIVLKRYHVDNKLRVVTVLNEYLIGTSQTRSSQQLLLCYCKPYGPASRESISRWPKQVLKAAGVNTDVFKAYSTRSGAASAAKAADVPIGDITATAGWRSDSTFARFHDRPVTPEASANAFAHAALSTT